MNKQQIKWASGHGWFLTSTSSTVTVRDYEMDDGQYTPIKKTFDNISELKIWAGY